MCNTRWRLFRRLDGDGDKGFRLVRTGAKADEREPCPLARLLKGHVLLSVNTALEYREIWSNGARSYRCEPHLLAFDVRALHQTPAPHQTGLGSSLISSPEHPYRGIVGRPSNRRRAIAQYRRARRPGLELPATPTAGGRSKNLIRFPLRACYPQAALHERTAHVMAVE